MKKSSLIAVVVCCLFAVSACSTAVKPNLEQSHAEKPQSKSVAPKNVKVPEPEPRPQSIVEITAKTRPFSATCSSSDYGKKTQVSNMEEALSLPPDLRASCEVTLSGSALYPFEHEALKAGEYKPDSLHILYELCLKQHLYFSERRFLSVGQAKEAKAALVLCPDHPDHANIEASLQESERLAKLKAEGRTFGPGAFKVGQQIQPGSYYSEVYGEQPFEACYWEMRDEAGQILDNNFAPDVFRVEVTIPDFAYSFSSEGCGQFKPISE